MPRLLSTRKSIVLCVFLALALSLMSSLVERKGPELASYGNLCGPSGDQDCLEPILNAGFPFGYLFDQPGVSVERNLFILEDNFRPLPFVLDFFLYLAVFAVVVLFAHRLRNSVSQPPPHSDA